MQSAVPCQMEQTMRMVAATLSMLFNHESTVTSVANQRGSPSILDGVIIGEQNQMKDRSVLSLLFP